MTSSEEFVFDRNRAAKRAAKRRVRQFDTAVDNTIRLMVEQRLIEKHSNGSYQLTAKGKKLLEHQQQQRYCADCGAVIPEGQPLCNCNTSGDLG